MTTNQEFINFVNKRILGANEMETQFFDYLAEKYTQIAQEIFPIDVVSGGALGLAADGVDCFQITSSYGSFDGLGHHLKISESQYSGIQFENMAAILYYIGLHYCEVPTEVQINPRTGQPEYASFKEEIGEVSNPNSVVDNGTNLTFVVDSVCEPLVSNAGRQALIWKVGLASEATSFSVAVETCSVVWDGLNNTITTSGLLGQTTVSTTNTDYMVALIGPTVRRNLDLSGESGYVFVGTVTGAGAGIAPSVFDTSLQAVLPTNWISSLYLGFASDVFPVIDNTYSLGKPTNTWANVYTQNLSIANDFLPITDNAQDIGQASILRWKDLFLAGSINELTEINFGASATIDFNSDFLINLDTNDTIYFTRSTDRFGVTLDSDDFFYTYWDTGDAYVWFNSIYVNDQLFVNNELTVDYALYVQYIDMAPSGGYGQIENVRYIDSDTADTGDVGSFSRHYANAYINFIHTNNIDATGYVQLDGDLRVDGVIRNQNSNSDLSPICVGKLELHHIGSDGIDMLCTAYGEGRYVALRSTASGNGIAVSGDGIVWTPVSFTDPSTWRKVCWGDGLFVAVSNTGNAACVLTSSNGGYSWVARTPPEANTWYGVCYSPSLDLFVAVSAGGTNQIMISSDAITWTAIAQPASNQWWDVCWSESVGLFVAVSRDGSNRVMTSSNGATWTLRSTPSQTWWKVCYGDYGFVAVDMSGSYAMHSVDGITWTQYSTGITANQLHVCWNGYYYAVLSGEVGSDTNQCVISFNGTTWTRLDHVAGSFHAYDIIAGDRKIVAVGGTDSGSHFTGCSMNFKL